MTNTIPSKAFILAAGLGSRLRPYTNDRPKPLVEVAGQSLLNRTLDHLSEAGITEATLNLHYRPEQIRQTCEARSDFTFHFSEETELLDTGGGIKKALHHFENPFYILSGDGLWSNAPHQNTLKTMADAWDNNRMDILMLLQPVSSMTLTQGVGDYTLDDNGRAARSKDKTGTHMFTSMRINAPHIFDNTPNAPFSYRDLMDTAQEKGRLFGIVHDGDWHHISTPKDLEAVDAAYKKQDEQKAQNE